jgi:hypothetical protein
MMPITKMVAIHIVGGLIDSLIQTNGNRRTIISPHNLNRRWQFQAVTKTADLIWFSPVPTLLLLSSFHLRSPVIQKGVIASYNNNFVSPTLLATSCLGGFPWLACKPPAVARFFYLAEKRVLRNRLILSEPTQEDCFEVPRL